MDKPICPACGIDYSDTLQELQAQADALGTESLTEDQQAFLLFNKNGLCLQCIEETNY